MLNPIKSPQRGKQLAPIQNSQLSKVGQQFKEMAPIYVDKLHKERQEQVLEDKKKQEQIERGI